MHAFAAYNLEKEKLLGNGRSAFSVCSASAKTVVGRDDVSSMWLFSLFSLWFSLLSYSGILIINFYRYVLWYSQQYFP